LLGLRKNERKAVDLWTEAAELGSVEALYNLGAMYHYGMSVEENKAKSAEFYTKAALRGSVEGRFQLGVYEGEKQESGLI